MHERPAIYRLRWSRYYLSRKYGDFCWWCATVGAWTTPIPQEPNPFKRAQDFRAALSQRCRDRASTDATSDL